MGVFEIAGIAYVGPRSAVVGAHVRAPEVAPNEEDAGGAGANAGIRTAAAGILSCPLGARGGGKQERKQDTAAGAPCRTMHGGVLRSNRLKARPPTFHSQHGGLMQRWAARERAAPGPFAEKAALPLNEAGELV